MTENKRFVNEDDCYGYYTEIIDNEKELDLSLPNPKKNLTIEELVDLMNELADENEQLRKDATILVYSNQEYRKENDELKKELMEFKKWEKHIGDVKREELDRVFKMSIYEIAEAFEYYEKRIEKLERSCND